MEAAEDQGNSVEVITVVTPDKVATTENKRETSTIVVGGARMSLAAMRALQGLDAEEPLPAYSRRSASSNEPAVPAPEAGPTSQRQRPPFGYGDDGTDGSGLPGGPARTPWHDRDIAERDETLGLAAVFSEHVVQKTEYGLRSSLIGMMPSAALVAAPTTQPFFVSQSFVLLGALIGSGETLGASVAFSLVFLKGALFWVPFCTLMNYVGLWESAAAWNVVYAVTCFVIAVVGTGFTARLCLIFFNICMMAQEAGTGRSLTFPSHGILELLIGMGFGLLSVVFPRVSLATQHADRIIQSALAKDLVACFPAVHRALWARNTTERNILGRRLVAALKKMEEAYQGLQMQMRFGEYEMMFLSVFPLTWPSELRRGGAAAGKVPKYHGFGKGIREHQVRLVVCRAMKDLIFRTACLARVVEVMKELDVIVPQTEAHASHNAALMAALDRLTEHVSHAIEVVALVPTREAAIEAIGMSELRGTMDEMHDCIATLREDLFHNVDFREYERVQSVVGFYLFAVGQVVEVLGECEDALKNEANFPSTWLVSWLFFWTSASSTVTRAVHIARHPLDPAHLRIFMEALKLSGSMIASVRFFIFMSAQTAYLSGPSVIAFCAGDTFGESVNGGFQRLSGVLFGNVLGYFADSYADTPAQKVASLCTIFCVCNWLRNGKRFGGAAFYAAFNVLSMIALVGAPKTTTYLTARIQQNTFAVLIYCAASLIIWPPKPLQALREKRSRTIKALEATFSAMLGMFGVPLSDSATLKQRLGELRAKRGAAIAEVEREAAFLAAAEDEPICTALMFPTALNRDIYATERRLLFTLDVFVGAWTLIANDTEKVMRPTLERFLLSLAPTAADLAMASKALTNLIRELVLNPFASLSADIIIESVGYVQVSHMLRDRLAEGFRAIVLRSQAMKARGCIGGASGADFGDAAAFSSSAAPMSGTTRRSRSGPVAFTMRRRSLEGGSQSVSADNGSPEMRHLTPQPLSPSASILQRQRSPADSTPSSMLPRDRLYCQFLESLRTAPEDRHPLHSPTSMPPAKSAAGSPDGDEDGHLGLVPARHEDILAIHSVRHALGSYVELQRTLELCVNDMHAFDAATNINPGRIPLVRRFYLGH